MKLPVKKLFFCSVAAALLCLAAHRIGLLLYQTFYFDVLPAYESPAGVEWEAGCPLHTHEETNAPVLLNAHTGLAAELRIFEPHRTVANEISEQDEYGFMRSDYGPGYLVRAFPDEHRAVVRVERAALYQYSGEAAEAFFCDSCLSAFAELNPKCNFIIADCCDMSSLKYYALEEVARREGLRIRHYDFVCGSRDSHGLSFTIRSSYFEDGGELNPPDGG